MLLSRLEDTATVISEERDKSMITLQGALLISSDLNHGSNKILEYISLTPFDLTSFFENIRRQLHQSLTQQLTPAQAVES